MDCKAIIERLKLKTGFTQKRIAEEIFNISDKNLSNKLRRNTIDMDPLLSWSVNESVDLNWLLTGNECLSSNGGPQDFDSESLVCNRPKTLDSNLLTRILKAIEKELDARGLELAPEKKAEAVALLYEMYVGTEKEVSEETIGRYLRLVA